MNREVSNIIEFTLIYNRYKAKLYNYVYKMVNNNSLCDDIVQNVFMRFYMNMNKIRNKESIEFWIFKSARNEVYNYYRSKKLKSGVYLNAEVEDLAASDYENTEIEYERQEMHLLIVKELEKFPVEQRECYLLKEYSGLTYKEIADITGTTEDLVKSRLFKVRRKLVDKISKILFYGV